MSGKPRTPTSPVLSPPVLRGAGGGVRNLTSNGNRTKSTVMNLRDRFERVTEAEKIMQEMEDISRLEKVENAKIKNAEVEEAEAARRRSSGEKRRSKVVSIVFEDISSGEDNEGTEEENNSTRPSSARLNSIQEEESGGKERGGLESSCTTTTTEEEIALAQAALAQAMGALNVQAEEANMKRQPSISIQRGNSVTKGSDASSSSGGQRDLSGKIEFARGAEDFGAFKDCVLDLLSEMARRLQDLECRSGQSPPAAAVTPAVAAAGPPPPAPPPPPPPPPPPMAAPAPLKIPKGSSNQKQQHVKVVISETDGGAGGVGSGGDLMSQLANTLNRRKNRTSLANAYNNLK